MNDSAETSSSGGILRFGVVALVLGVLAVTLSEGLRNRVLDALFGAEEEFEYEPSNNGHAHSVNGVEAANPAS